MKHWSDTQERSHSWVMRLIVWIALHMGWHFPHLLLYPITFYFFITGKKTRQVSRQYLQRVSNKKVNGWQIAKHIHTFSTTLLDRIYLLSNQLNYFDIRLHGLEVIENKLSSGGCFLLGSHLGSFDVLRALANQQKNLNIRVLMDKQHNPMITKILDEINPDIAKMIIQIGTTESLITLKEALDEGAVIALLGDRVLDENRTIECDFLGKKAIFSTGPLLLANLLKTPVILFFGLYRGGNRYDVYFELFTETMHFHRSKRDEQLKILTCRYANRLEYYTQQAPYNWFNFYDFWSHKENSNTAHAIDKHNNTSR